MEAVAVVLAGGISSRMRNTAAAPGSNAPEVDPRLLGEAREKAKAMIGVGPGGRPFLDYVLRNLVGAGHSEILIVTAERDASIREYYADPARSRDFPGASFSFVPQPVPAGRSKPEGTADALLRAIEALPGWAGGKITVCNSDNVYSMNALSMLLNDPHPNLVAVYDRDALGHPPERTEAFSVVTVAPDGSLRSIEEKPGPASIAAAAGPDGRVGVSMNLFRLTCADIAPWLRAVPFHPVRNERELPVAVGMMAADRPGSVRCLRLAERVPDLTQAADIPGVRKILREAGADAPGVGW